MPIKKQFQEINWIKIMVEIAAITTAVLTMAALLGDGRFANREKTEAEIHKLELELKANEVKDEQHHDSSDVHMSYQSKRTFFVTRVEWENSKHSATSALRELKGDFKEFCQEQREVNMEILDRLP